MTGLATATTVLLLRQDADDLRVFLVKRHRGSGFMPSAWVFPGGRIEPGDAEVPAHLAHGGGHAAAALGYPAPLDRAVLVGGVRETFEESGIWLGRGALPQDVRGPLAAGQVALSDLLGAHDAAMDLDTLHPWARWVTPEGERRRFDTAFLVAMVEETGGRHDATETVDSGWFTPSEVLGAGMERMGLAPPTWWTLTELAALRSLDGVRDALGRRDLRPVQPVLAVGDAGVGILLPGDDAHPEPRRPDLPTRIELTPEGWAARG